jgi:hypothetical protein
MEQNKKTPDIHVRTLFVAETAQLLSEKSLACESIAVATLTSDKGFAARTERFMAGRGF